MMAIISPLHLLSSSFEMFEMSTLKVAVKLGSDIESLFVRGSLNFEAKISIWLESF